MTAKDASSYRPNFFAEAMGIAQSDVGDKEVTAAEIPTGTEQWVLQENLNDIEEEYVEHIFKGYKSNESDSKSYYLDIRQKIINLYKEDTKKFITAKYCIDSIDGDAATIAKVFCLLDYWGVINYAAARRFADTDGHLNHYKKDMDPIKPRQKVSSEYDLLHVLPTFPQDDEEEEQVCMRRLVADKDELEQCDTPYTGLGAKKFDCLDPTKRARKCHTCRYPCKFMYFMLRVTVLPEELKRYKDEIWCTKCYSNSQYPLDLPRNSLIRVMAPIGTEYSKHSFMKNKWTKDKMERLYEAIDKLGLNWEMIQTQVGEDVTIRECIYQFLISPIATETKDVIPIPVSFDSMPNAENEVPFYRNPNTIAAFLSFCSSALSPVVSSRAAKAIFELVMQKVGPKEQRMTGYAADGQRSDVHNQMYPNMYHMNERGPVPEFGDMNMMDPMMASGGDLPPPPDATKNYAGMAYAPPEDDKVHLGDRSNPTISEEELYAAYKAGFQASVDTSAEIAEMEQEKINELLQNLIELRIKRIKQKIRQFEITGEQMDNSNVRMLYNLSTRFKSEDEVFHPS